MSAEARPEGTNAVEEVTTPAEDIESEDVSEDESEENVELKDIFQQLQNPKTTDKVIMQLLCVLGNTKRNLPSVEIFQNWDGSET